MRLYADDLSDASGALIWNSDMNEALRRILPSRCPDCEGTGEWCAQHRQPWNECPNLSDDGFECSGFVCRNCDELGWLYPDMPEGWWGDKAHFLISPPETVWQNLCERMWEAMGITDET